MATKKMHWNTIFKPSMATEDLVDSVWVESYGRTQKIRHKHLFKQHKVPKFKLQHNQRWWRES